MTHQRYLALKERNPTAARRIYVRRTRMAAAAFSHYLDGMSASEKGTNILESIYVSFLRDVFRLMKSHEMPVGSLVLEAMNQFNQEKA